MAAYLPTRRREDVFLWTDNETERLVSEEDRASWTGLLCSATYRSVVPTPLNDLPRMGLVLLDRRVMDHSHVVVDVKIEQRTGFPSGLVDDEVVEGVVLQRKREKAKNVRRWADDEYGSTLDAREE
jgi:hypothetical protein